MIFCVVLSIVHAQETDYSVTPEEFLGPKGLATYLIKEYASEYGIDWHVMYRIVDCETGHTFDTNTQSTVRYSRDIPAWGVKKGDREQSYGLAQYHLPAHPDMTIEDATNPHFALNRMAKDIADGKVRQWSCYRP